MRVCSMASAGTDQGEVEGHTAKMALSPGRRLALVFGWELEVRGLPEGWDGEPWLLIRRLGWRTLAAWLSWGLMAEFQK